jgi:hypothetical protein
MSEGDERMKDGALRMPGEKQRVKGDERRTSNRNERSRGKPVRQPNQRYLLLRMRWSGMKKTLSLDNNGECVRAYPFLDLR